MKKLLFVYNPKSGKGKIKQYLYDVLTIFAEADYITTAYPTRFQGDGLEMILRNAGDYDLVVCAGGDGTINEAVTGLVNSGLTTPLACIPVGSTNDFTQSLKLPKRIPDAARVAVSGKPKLIDAGRFNTDNFAYVAAFGMFTDVSYATSQELKNVFGHAAYIVEGAKRLGYVPSYRLTIQYGDQIIIDDFAYGMISNSRSVAGVKNMFGKDVLLDDGLFEVNLVKHPKNPFQFNQIVTNLMRPKAIDTSLIYTFKTDKIRITCEDGPLAWTLDGEFGGDHTVADIGCLHKAINVVVRDK